MPSAVDIKFLAKAAKEWAQAEKDRIQVERDKLQVVLDREGKYDEMQALIEQVQGGEE